MDTSLLDTLIQSQSLTLSECELKRINYSWVHLVPRSKFIETNGDAEVWVMPPVANFMKVGDLGNGFLFRSAMYDHSISLHLMGFTVIDKLTLISMVGSHFERISFYKVPEDQAVIAALIGII